MKKIDSYSPEYIAKFLKSNIQGLLRNTESHIKELEKGNSIKALAYNRGRKDAFNNILRDIHNLETGKI